MDFLLKTEEETILLGKKLGEKLQKGAVIALNGNLAAGKTYFTKGIALGIGITEEITSPTFTIVSEYTGGAEDMLYGDGVCVIEWSKKVKGSLPKNTINVDISVNEDGFRRISIDGLPFDI